MIRLLPHYLLNSGSIHPSKYGFLKGARNCCECFMSCKNKVHAKNISIRRLVCTQNDCIENTETHKYKEWNIWNEKRKFFSCFTIGCQKQSFDFSQPITKKGLSPSNNKWKHKKTRIIINRAVLCMFQIKIVRSCHFFHTRQHFLKICRILIT